MAKDKLRHIAIKNRFESSKSYYRDIHYPEIPLSITDEYLITTIGDRLDLLAQSYYGDTSLWWIITRANPEVLAGDSYFIKPGTRIRIPIDKDAIVRQYEELNFPKLI